MRGTDNVRVVRDGTVNGEVHDTRCVDHAISAIKRAPEVVLRKIGHMILNTGNLPRLVRQFNVKGNDFVKLLHFSAPAVPAPQRKDTLKRKGTLKRVIKSENRICRHVVLSLPPMPPSETSSSTRSVWRGPPSPSGFFRSLPSHISTITLGLRAHVLSKFCQSFLNFSGARLGMRGLHHLNLHGQTPKRRGYTAKDALAGL